MVDRRSFLRGLAASQITSRTPTDVYGLNSADAELLFPSNAAVGMKFEIRLHGRGPVEWPKNVVWQSGRKPVPTSDSHVYKFLRVDHLHWSGTVLHEPCKYARFTRKPR